MRRDEARAGISRKPAGSARVDRDPEVGGVYVSLEDLIGMRARARGFSFLPRQPVESLLSGRHASRMRGRGLNFEEIRAYLPGDDIRTIDWKITARIGEPHIRVYTEERDRPAILVLDQRLSMFFGSRRSLKSVVAAELSAVGAWRVLDAGDRVGAVLFNDEETVEIRPQRSRRTVLHLLGEATRLNRALSADSDHSPAPGRLNEALKRVAGLVNHDYLVAVVSDFDGADAETTRLMTRMAEHNDVVAFLVHDPMARVIPEGVPMVVSDGRLQVELKTQQGSVRTRLQEFTDQRISAILDWQDKRGIPVIPISTETDPVDQLVGLTGGGRR
jgi:uncharacterized protein (DUF58 family)